MDALINAADSALRTLFAKPHASRPCPTVPGQGTEFIEPLARPGEVVAFLLAGVQELLAQNGIACT